MGWTSTYRAPGYTDGGYFAAHVFGNDSVIHCSRTVRNVFYAACSNKRNPGEIFAVIILLRRYKRDSWGMNFSWKDMDEGMLPYYFDCPAVVLDCLSPTANENATRWRASCQARLDKPSPRLGQWIELAQPVSFGGMPETRLRKASLPRRKNIFQTAGGRYVRFTNLKNYDYRIVPDVPVTA